MKSLLSSIKPAKPPATVRTLAESVFMKGQISVLEFMRLMESVSRPRPFYLIAHGVNNVSTAAVAIARGANAVEFDIELPDNLYESSDWEFSVRHFPTQVGQPIKQYLDGLAILLKQNPKVALVYFDIKNANINLTRLREIIHEHLTNVVPIQIILSHAHWEGRGLFNPITRDTPGEGLLIDEDDDPNRCSHFFSEEKHLTRFGYGNGVVTWGVPEVIPGSIMQAVALKWGFGKIRWVCTYTLANQNDMRDYIAKGVDGIMVDDVPALKEVFEKFAAKYRLRLAERTDDPFDPPVHPSYVLTVLTSPELTGAGTDADLTFVLGGSKGTIEATIDAFPAGLFEEGLTNYVTLIGKDVGKIKSLTLSQDGVGDWHVAYVMVRKRGSPDTLMFDFNNQAIHPDKPVIRTV